MVKLNGKECPFLYFIVLYLDLHVIKNTFFSVIMWYNIFSVIMWNNNFFFNFLDVVNLNTSKFDFKILQKIVK